ncbi:metallophosphoesterase [Archangium primigenium]|uniref:metallophosphoesterase n=1 Tax=[Archangium] primigenium TaxID=2792470 RepID=UPI0019562C8D|nr:metallophosphoesterase [Archangium primigenium]MBM7116902.1 metallophosphoesterase [Archangium primigenium]
MAPRSSLLLKPEVRAELERDLRKTHALSGPWDLVLISGDLTSTGTGREFELLDATLDSLWDVFRSLGSEPCLLVVPGNHDCMPVRHGIRYPVEQLRAEFRTGTDASSDLVKHMKGAFAPFSEWFADWRRLHAMPGLRDFRAGLLPGDFVATLERDGTKVGIVGFNSIFRGDLRADDGNLCEVHLEQVEHAMGVSAEDWARAHDLVLMLTHHPPRKLNPGPLARIQEALTPPSGLLLYLCGSLYDELATPSLLVNAAPSLFGQATTTRGRAGYIAGRIDLEEQQWGVRLLPRMALATKGRLLLGPDERCEPDEWLEAPLDALRGQSLVTPSMSAMESLPWREARGVSTARLDGRLRSALRVSPPAPMERGPPGVALRKVLETGGRRIGSVAWSSSGDALGVGFSDGHLLWWSVGEDAPQWVGRAHESECVGVCFSPDGETLASRSRQNIRLWMSDGRQLKTPQRMQGRGSLLGWSSKGRLAAEVAGDALQLWNDQTWAPSHSLLPRHGPYGLSWSPDGRRLVCAGDRAAGGALSVWDISDDGQSVVESFLLDDVDALDVAWMPGTSRVAVAGRDGNVYVVDLQDDPVENRVLEGHTDAVASVAFSFDGQLLASRSLEGLIRLFRTDTWEPVAQFGQAVARPWSYMGLTFSPRSHVLAVPGPDGRNIGFWGLDLAVILGAPTPSPTVHEVSAKVVLVGEGRAGKSCLALRLVKDEYQELESTHGMRFWTLPMAPATPDNPRREIILWDLGGQSEYRLVHQLFLRESSVALMVMEPGRGAPAVEEVEGWEQRLRVQPGGQRIRRLLVGTKVDTPESPVDGPALEGLARRLDPSLSYVLTSAKNGQGISELKRRLDDTIDWKSLEQVSRPELFQRLRQLVLRRRQEKRVVMSFWDLESELRREVGGPFDFAALEAVVGHLTRQGFVADTRMAGGTRMLILEVEQIERYAGSLIVAARDNPHGVPALEERKVLAPDMTFPRLRSEDRLPEDQEATVLNCVIKLMLEHGICLRHEGRLIFPSLFRATEARAGVEFAHAISLHYDFLGPIDNIYASLICAIALAKRFGVMRLWESRAEFGQAGHNSVGVRRSQVKRESAKERARLDVYFDTGTNQTTRELFVGFVEEHLREHGVDVLERLSITCVCGRVFSDEVVRGRLLQDKWDVGCEMCDRRIPITRSAQQVQASDPEQRMRLVALREDVDARRVESINETGTVVTRAKRLRSSQEQPIRILHLSDLHITAGDDPIGLLQPLAADLQQRSEDLSVEQLDYLVVSGDITQRATPEEFMKAYEFISALLKRFSLTPERCIIVPGNHDLSWEPEVYTWRAKRHVDMHKYPEDSVLKQGQGYLVRDEAKYPERFKNFSKHFYESLFLKEYPLKAEEQCIPLLFSETRLQFLAMNSAWQIDEYHQNHSSISSSALSRGLDRAELDLHEARKSGDLPENTPVLRLAVCHHPITGNEKIQEDAFVERLGQQDFGVFLHGHVHEERADLLNPHVPHRSLHVIGAGSFGASARERPESTPRLYNLLEVQQDLQSLRVHTRHQRKHGGPWEGRAVWPSEKPTDKRTYYDILRPRLK